MNSHHPWSLRAVVADPTRALHRARQAIEATDPALRAWVELVDDPQPSGGGPLAGVPLAVKDIIDVAGLPTRCGSPLRAWVAPAETDAAVVTAWRVAGAVPIGKTVTTEFAYFSPGPTANPAAPGRTPGGSSSGSAAAVAAGHVPLALGSQTAGSVIRPAAFCGIAALVLSHGAIPSTGVTGLSPSLDAHGLFAASVDDLALAWSALTGEQDPATRPAPAPRLLMTDDGPLSDAMRAALHNAVDRLRSAGAVVDRFSEPMAVATLAAAHPVVMAWESARERAAELARVDELSVPLAQLLRRGAAIPETEYTAARERIAAAGIVVGPLLAAYDGVLAAAAPGAAPRGLDATGDPACSRPWQALGLPVVAVPGMQTVTGLPLGLQLVGRHGGEGDLLATAGWIADTLIGRGPSNLDAVQ